MDGNDACRAFLKKVRETHYSLPPGRKHGRTTLEAFYWLRCDGEESHPVEAEALLFLDSQPVPVLF